MWCCQLWKDAVLANAGASTPKGLRLQDCIVTEEGGEQRRAMVPLYYTGRRGAPDMLVKFCPFCGASQETR